jgi:hypothetical protein
VSTPAVVDLAAHVLAMKPIGTALFALAVLHTFSVGRINRMAAAYARGTAQENFLHFLGEIEVVFGLWAAVLISVWSVRFGSDSAVSYLSSVNFTEALFVFCIMCIAATRPVITVAQQTIERLAGFLPLPRRLALYATTLIVGPLLGSLITEPAAMTVTALLLKRGFFDDPRLPARCKYTTLGLLFVNVSIGGVLTNFAAPPVLMVAAPWQWTSLFMLQRFGLPAVVAVVTGTLAAAAFFRRELSGEPLAAPATVEGMMHAPWWVAAVHGAFLALTVLKAHHAAFFIPLFLFFLGWCKVTEEYQDELRMRESLLVAFFLGGLVTLGKLQDWWLQPLVAQLGDLSLFAGATALTAVTDNAALTYLGTLVPDLSATAKYALVAGAVTGGGLTVIANAPNPAGYGILNDSFGPSGIKPLALFLGACPFTLLAAVCFWLASR